MSERGDAGGAVERLGGRKWRPVREIDTKRKEEGWWCSGK